MVDETGDSGDNTLTGSSGQDTLSGLAGNDSLVGLSGNDLLLGGDDNILNPTTLAAYNAAAGTSFATALAALNDDISDGAFDFNGVDFTGPTLTLTGVTSLKSDESGVVCFATGTLIATPNGEIPIERLRAGDLIQTMDNGLKPLVMSAYRALGPDDLSRNPKLKPIFLRPGAFGTERPLIVSPQHGVLVKMNGEEILARAMHLADKQGDKVRRMEGCQHVVYIHLVFEQHQIIFANGRPSESLYPGTQALKTMAPDALEEFKALFPDMVAMIDADQAEPMKCSWTKARMYSKRKYVMELGDLQAVAL